MTHQLYLMRHGQAGVRGSYADDRLRPLTDEGRARTLNAGRALKRLGVRPSAILTSPLVRAHQTAEIVADALQLSERLELLDSLAIGSDPSELLRDLLAAFESAGDDLGGSILAVGHEPDLSIFISSLISADATARVRVKKGAIIQLELQESGEATLKSLLPPKTLDLLGAR